MKQLINHPIELENGICDYCNQFPCACDCYDYDYCEWWDEDGNDYDPYYDEDRPY